LTDKLPRSLERGLDLVPVVDKGELVGCLMEKEIAHLLEDDVTE
jgi:magnesium transporter